MRLVSAGLLVAGRARTLLNIDHLAASIRPACGADVVGLLRRAAVAAWHELRGGDVVVATAIALMGPADALLGKCTHGLFSFCPRSIRIVAGPLIPVFGAFGSLVIQQVLQCREPGIDVGFGSIVDFWRSGADVAAVGAHR